MYYSVNETKWIYMAKILTNLIHSLVVVYNDSTITTNVDFKERKDDITIVKKEL